MQNLKRGVAGLAALSIAAAGVVGTVGVVTAQDDELVVGVSWNNFQEERWGLWDEPALKAALEAAGAQYVSTDAASSIEKQLTDIEALINQGADALIILAQDDVAILPAVSAALDEGIPVVAYDRLIEDPGVFYVSFNNVEIGRMQGRAMLEEVPAGNYVFIKGNAADPNADFLFAGTMEILQDAIDSGDIANVGEQYTDNWDPAVAQRNMEQILTDNDNDVDAVVAQNDGTAGGAIAALDAQGLAGEVPVSGQDAEGAALNRIAKGTQTQTVWVDGRTEATAAAGIAVALAQGAALDAVEGSVVFADGPSGVPVNAVLLDPVSVTQDNLGDLVEAGWISEEELCAGVEAGAIAACP
jgi:D-xylose transport system substrate-binding protein